MNAPKLLIVYSSLFNHKYRLSFSLSRIFCLFAFPPFSGKGSSICSKIGSSHLESSYSLLVLAKLLVFLFFGFLVSRANMFRSLNIYWEPSGFKTILISYGWKVCAFLQLLCEYNRKTTVHLLQTSNFRDLTIYNLNLLWIEYWCNFIST